MDQYFLHFTMLFQEVFWIIRYLSDFKCIPSFIHQFMYLFIHLYFKIKFLRNFIWKSEGIYSVSKSVHVWQDEIKEDFKGRECEFVS